MISICYPLQREFPAGMFPDTNSPGFSYVPLPERNSTVLLLTDLPFIEGVKRVDYPLVPLF